jgi:hypothetical protein
MLNVAFLGALAATFGALVFGMICFFKGGDFNKKYGNAAMRARVLLQGFALFLFYLLIKSGGQ